MLPANLVFLIGRATEKSTLKDVGKSQVSTVRLAVNDRIKVGDEWKDKTMYIDVEVWGKRAEYVANNVDKGSVVHVQGKLELDEWNSSDGSKRQKHKVYVGFDGNLRVDKFANGDSKGSSGDNKQSSNGGGDDLPF